MYHVCALYRFSTVDDVGRLRDHLDAAMNDHGVLGTLLVAPEGINGTIAGPRTSVDAVLAAIAEAGFDSLSCKWATCQSPPFKRAKVRIKKEIVTLGVDGIDPNHQVGQYVEPEDWNDLIDDPDVVVIDTRNDYETSLGAFEGAIDPNTESFRQFPDYIDQSFDPDKTPKVAMYCTGGIRCEKATALLKQKGFEQVYHLRGGILEYLRRVEPTQSRWNGDCFVFDERVAVDHRLNPSGHRLCRGCGWAVDPQQAQDPRFIEGVQCPRCAQTLTEDQKRRFAMRQSQLKRSPDQASPGEILRPECD